jgi:nucleoside-triphosphatase THEP1
MSENSLETRKVMVVGKTGVGKSKICNKILDKAEFKVSYITESFTDKISNHTLKVAFKDESKVEIPFMLNVYDTPGLDDSKGRSKQFLNEIASTILKEKFNMIIVIVEYGKFSTSIQNNLEVLRECLNDLSQSSTMIIINKVPLETTLEKKRSDGEIARERTEVLDETFLKYSKALGCSFKYQFLLENDEHVDNNKDRFNLIKEVIFNCSSFIDTSNVRTWDEVVKTYRKDSSSVSEQELNESMSKEAANITDKLSKIEFDIADIKYPFLNSKNKIATIIFNSHKEFVESFECEILEEDYLQKKNFNWKKLAKYATVSGTVAGSIGGGVGDIIFSGDLITSGDPFIVGTAIAFGLLNLGYKAGKKLTNTYKNCQNITEDLTELGGKRAELKEELRKCQSSIDELKKRLEERKAKIISLESALVIQTQTSN